MTQNDALDTWWFNLSNEARRLALAVPAKEPLSEQAMRSLRRCGVHVPEVALVWSVAGVKGAATTYPQPAAVTAYLDRLRPARG